MTAFREPFPFPQPLSAISIGLVNDLGYSVDWSKGDVFDITDSAYGVGLKSNTIKVTVEN
jgi:hypothetical protein